MGKQCCQAVKKANRILGMMKINFTDRSQSTLIHFVQKSSQTKLIKDVDHLLYNDRLLMCLHKNDQE